MDNDIGQIISDFLAETGALIEQADFLPFDTAVELYGMYGDIAKAASGSIRVIDPALRRDICSRQDIILDRIIDFDPVVDAKNCRHVYTPAVQGYRTWGNFELLKDKGLVGYTLAEEIGAAAVMHFGTAPEDYPYLPSLPGLELLYCNPGVNMKDAYASHLAENAGKMDALMLHGIYDENIAYLRSYKKMRPDGKAYCGLDMNTRWMEHSPWECAEARQFGTDCDVIATSCRPMRDKLNGNPKVSFPCRWYPNAFYNPGGIDIKADARQKDNIILTVARIGTEQKNNEELLTGFAKAADDLPGWQLRLVGPIEPHFHAYIDEYFKTSPVLKERVIFTGAITDKSKLFEEYARAKVFALTSHSEGAPNVFAEALVHGCMFVTSDIDAADDITYYGQLGQKYPYGDLNALSDALKAVCLQAANSKFLSTHIEKALAYAARYYDWDRNAKKLAYMLFR